MNENMIGVFVRLLKQKGARPFIYLSLHSKDAVFSAQFPKIPIASEVVRPYEYRNLFLAVSPNTLVILQTHRDLEISGLQAFHSL